MAKLSDDEAKQLAALQAKHDAPDDPGDDDVEWWEDGAGGRGARMRASRARTHGPDWLREHLADRDAKPDEGDGQDGDGQGDGPAGQVKRFQRGRRVG